MLKNLRREKETKKSGASEENSASKSMTFNYFRN